MLLSAFHLHRRWPDGFSVLEFKPLLIYLLECKVVCLLKTHKKTKQPKVVKIVESTLT